MGGVMMGAIIGGWEVGGPAVSFAELPTLALLPENAVWSDTKKLRGSWELNIKLENNPPTYLLIQSASIQASLQRTDSPQTQHNTDTVIVSKTVQHEVPRASQRASSVLNDPMSSHGGKTAANEWLANASRKGPGTGLEVFEYQIKNSELYHELQAIFNRYEIDPIKVVKPKRMFRGTWLQWSTLLLTLLGTRLVFVVAQCGSFAQDRLEKEDKQDKLALYKVTLRTYWSRARFPRHYPEWKPPAQFGKLIGNSGTLDQATLHLNAAAESEATQIEQREGVDTDQNSI
ncbi:hypothetical protein WN55_02472 [Dufourea novaeangliae]|uniref:Spondin domain-containing protein n=1 Tax=Dufourea novaeangliae TaxID=178035 RepID=A0A154PGX4_DUFNO|nr:hypothetical protein WN55_02472 [Dufourea novaeangliae]